MFDNVIMKDLWDSLALVVPIGFLPRGKTLENVMDTWTRIAGYPVVTVVRNYTTKIATFSQVSET
jgi:aminopeptidase N